MCLVLGIDTTERRTFLALAEGSVVHGASVVETFATNKDTTSSGDIISCLHQTCRNGGRRVADIKVVAVAVGPGSYTGIRTGIATAQGLAMGLGVPARGISVLKARILPYILGPGKLVASLTASISEKFVAAFDINRVEGGFDNSGVLHKLKAERGFAELSAELESFEINQVADVEAISDQQVAKYLKDEAIKAGRKNFSNSARKNIVELFDCDSVERANAAPINPALLVALGVVLEANLLKEFNRGEPLDFGSDRPQDGVFSLKPAYIKKVNARTLAERAAQSSSSGSFPA